MLNNQVVDINKKLDVAGKKETNVVLQILAFFIASIFISIIIFVFIPPLSAPNKENLNTLTWLANRLVASSVSLVATISASILCIKRFTNRSPYSLGYLPHKGFLKDFFLGCLIGILLVSSIALLQWIVGGTQFFLALAERNISPFGLIAITSVLFIAAFEEEVIFRGYPLQALAINLSPMFATLITSGLFGLVHANNPNATVFSTINTILAGIWLSVAYFKTRSLSLATGLHLGWNFSMGTVYGLPVSGITRLTDYSLLDSRDLGKTWLTGGSYGPEGGAITTVILILGIILLIKLPFLKISPEMAKFFPITTKENLNKD
jgi:membrane protease YdiL (CAAX protease family)